MENWAPHSDLPAPRPCVLRCLGFAEHGWGILGNMKEGNLGLRDLHSRAPLSLELGEASASSVRRVVW